MKITFLGTSHGVPEPNRRCSCTMLEVQGRYYFIDMGIMAIDELMNRGIAVEDIRAAFFTHMHGDHTNGLIHFVDLISWFFKKADPAIYLPDIRGAEIIRQWLEITGSTVRDLRYNEIQPGLIYDDGFIKITAIGTQHCPLSYAFLVEAEGKTLLFTGDLKRPGVDFPQIAKEQPIDLLICESAHFPATEYAPVLSQCQIRQVLVHHYVPQHIPSIMELMQRTGSTPVRMAHDGLEIIL